MVFCTFYGYYRYFFFFFNDTATTEIYTLSLHDALPIWSRSAPSIIDSPIRSFIEPVGLRYSSLTQISTPLAGTIRRNRTRSVPPIVPMIHACSTTSRTYAGGARRSTQETRCGASSVRDVADSAGCRFLSTHLRQRTSGRVRSVAVPSLVCP